MNDHLHAAGLLEPVVGEVGSLTGDIPVGIEHKSGFYVIAGLRECAICFTVRLRHVNSDCGGNGWRMLMAAPNCELEPVNLIPLTSEVAVAVTWADMSHAL